MSDSKTTYSTTVSKIKQIAESNSILRGTLEKEKLRAIKHGLRWNSVNINDVVNKFAPGALAQEKNGKIMFSNGGSFTIVTDVAGGYLRIQDTSKGNHTYITTNGEYRSKSISKSEWKKMTHYRIKKLEEM